MALTYVGGNSGTWVGATSGDNNVSLTALTGGSDSAAAAGDIVVAVYCTRSTSDRTLAIGDGTNPYTLAGSELYANGTTHDTNLRVAYKVLSAADTDCVFGPTGDDTEPGAVVLHVWRGVDSSTPMDVSVVTATGTGGAAADGGAITPSTAGAVVIVAGGGAKASTGDAAYTQSGSELSNFISTSSNDVGRVVIGIGSFAWSSGAFDPVAWVCNGGAQTSWCAITLALRPASGAQTLTPSLVTNSQTFYAPTVGRGAVGLTPGLFTNTQAFYSPTVSLAGGAQSLTPSLYTNTNTFYAPTVSSEYALTPSLFSNTNAFYAPTVTVGAVTLAPALFTNANTFYPATVSQPGAAVTEPATDTHDGGWLPTRIKSKTHRKKFERLYEDMIALYEQLSTEAVAEVPMEKPAVADYVKPAPVVARAKVIPPPVIDWSALNRDMTRLYLLIEQNRQLIEDQDEEEAVMLLLM